MAIITAVEASGRSDSACAKIVELARKYISDDMEELACDVLDDGVCLIYDDMRSTPHVCPAEYFFNFAEKNSIVTKEDFYQQVIEHLQAIEKLTNEQLEKLSI